MYPNVRYIENKDKSNRVWAVRPVRKSAPPLGHVCRWKKQKQKCAKRGKTCRLQSQNAVDCGRPLGAGTIKQKDKGSSGNGRWAGEPERGRWYGTSRALNRKPMVNNVQPKYRNTLRGTYAGDQYDASGRQRGTLILSMGPARAVNGTPKVDNV